MSGKLLCSIVECLSPANRKGSVTELLEDYRKIHTPEIWLIRPDEEYCEVYRGEFPSSAIRSGSLTFGGVVIPLEALWNAWKTGRG